MGDKLLNDCFLHDKDRMAHDDALALLRSRLTPVTGTETMPLGDAAGRILAAPATASQPVPAHTNAAVDGFAFCHSCYNREGGALFPVAGRSAAGHPHKGDVPNGSCVRILTGAVVPDQLDTVAMQEDCRLVGAGEAAPNGERAQTPSVWVPGGLKSGANVRLAGEDVQTGDALFQPGHFIRPQDLAALASIGLGEVPCHRPLTIGIISTGDEVVPAGSRPLVAGEVYDANAPMLDALCRLAGCRVERLGIWPDEAALVRDRLGEAAGRFDVLLTSGGASQGEEDHMSAAIAALGQRHMWQIAVKPGRPLMFGQIGDTVCVGLPGNPVAVFVCFLMYVFPMLRRLAGGNFPQPRRYLLPASFGVPKRKLGRREFWRATQVMSEQGLVAMKYDRDGSGLISGLRASDGLIDVPEDVPCVAPGDRVAFIPYSSFGIVGEAP